jgi:hypothetical protein
VKGARWRRTKRVGLWILAALAAVVLALLVDGWQAFGHRASGARRERLERSAQWKSGHVVNPQPLVNSFWGAMRGAFAISPYASPTAPLPVVPVEAAQFQSPPPTGLRVTWLLSPGSGLAAGSRCPLR